MIKLNQDDIDLIQRIVSFIRENENDFELLDTYGPIDFNRRELFEKLSIVGDQDLSGWILRIVLGLEIKNYHSNTAGKLQGFIRNRDDSVTFSELYSSVIGLNFTWGLAEQLVEVLVQYTSYNGSPVFEDWCKALHHEAFAEFTRELYEATQGAISPRLYCEEATDFVSHCYEDFEYVGFDIFETTVKHISRSMAWIRDQFPLKYLEYEALQLIRRSAELLPFSCINLPGYPIIGGIEGIYEFLLICPEVALENICSVYCTWPNRDIFGDDFLYDLVFEISDQLSGNLLQDFKQITTNCDEDQVKYGASELLKDFGE